MSLFSSLPSLPPRSHPWNTAEQILIQPFKGSWEEAVFSNHICRAKERGLRERRGTRTWASSHGPTNQGSLRFLPSTCSPLSCLSCSDSWNWKRNLFPSMRYSCESSNSCYSVLTASKLLICSVASRLSALWGWQLQEGLPCPATCPPWAPACSTRPGQGPDKCAFAEQKDEWVKAPKR